MKIILLFVFILTACGLFLLLSGILRLPTLRSGRAMVRAGKKKRNCKRYWIPLHGWGGISWKYISMNVYKRNRMQNVLNAAGFKMSPETYMAYAYLKAGSVFY